MQGFNVFGKVCGIANTIKADGEIHISDSVIVAGRSINFKIDAETNSGPVADVEQVVNGFEPLHLMQHIFAAIFETGNQEIISYTHSYAVDETKYINVSVYVEG